MAIAGKVQRDGKSVTAEDVNRARREGASDVEIHDTVHIAAAFCMYNRYASSGAWAGKTEAAHPASGDYVEPPPKD